MFASRLARISLLIASSLAFGAEVKNDNLSGGSVQFQGGFVVGEMAAARLNSPFAQAHLTHVRFLYGGATGTRTINLHVWIDGAGTSPDTELFGAQYSVTANDSAFQELDLSAEAVTVPPIFRIGLEFQDPGLPSVAVDGDGNTTAQNYILATTPQPQWYPAENLGLTGDFILRAEVVEVASDAGVDAGTPDAGVVDGGVADAGMAPGGGCASNAACDVGSYCDPASRACNFDCRKDSDCSSGQTCSSLGRCVEPPSGGCSCGSAQTPLLGLFSLLFLAMRRRRSW